MVKSASSESIAFLNVGTKILTKDAMDQYIRTLGNHRTHYATTAKAAYRILTEDKISVIISESELPDTSVFRFLQRVRSEQKDPPYVILAIEKEDVQLRSLADEIEADAVLSKPFTAKQIGEKVADYQRKMADADDVENLLRAAEAAFREKAYSRADKTYKVILEKFTAIPRAHYKAGMYYLSKPDYVLAEKHLREALHLQPGFTPALGALGALFFRKRDFREAFRLLEDANERCPLNPDRAMLLSKLHLEWAIETLKSATRVDPSDTELHGELGRFLTLSRDYTSALRELKLASGVQEGTPPKEGPLVKERDGFINLVCELGSLR